MTAPITAPLPWTEEDFNAFFIISVCTEEGLKYAFNQRTLVHDIHFAKRFETRRSALRCVKLGGFRNWEIIKVQKDTE